MRQFHLPIWLEGASRPRAGTFIALFSLEAWCRATLITLVPLEALRILESAQSVSALYFAVAFIGLAVTLVIPMVVHLIRRRWALTFGVVLFLASLACYQAGSTTSFAVGLALQVAATAFFEIVLNLYVLDHVPRGEITRFEPRRLLFVAAPFTIGPWLGVFLATHAGPWATYVLVGVLSLTMLGFFWFLRITDNPAVATPLRPPPNPIFFLPKFFHQPRLLLAWTLAIGRSSWWILFFVYAPIYLTEIGYSRETAGLIVSMGVAPMFTAMFWGGLARRRGIRFVLILGYALMGVTTALVAPVSEPMLGAALIIASAATAIIVDGVGNAHFLRAVHPYERAEMTSVFVTFRPAAQLLTPGLFALILGVFTLPAVFVAGGVTCFGMAYLSRWLPRKM